MYTVRPRCQSHIRPITHEDPSGRSRNRIDTTHHQPHEFARFEAALANLDEMDASLSGRSGPLDERVAPSFTEPSPVRNHAQDGLH
jgi:hypothetical protein